MFNLRSSEDGSSETSTLMMTLGPLAVNCPELEREIVTALVLNYKSLGVPIRQLLAVVGNVAHLRCPGHTVVRVASQRCRDMMLCNY